MKIIYCTNKVRIKMFLRLLADDFVIAITVAIFFRDMYNFLAGAKKGVSNTQFG